MASLIRGGSLAPNTQQLAQLISQQQQQQSAVVAGQVGSGQQQATQAGQITAQQLLHTFTPHIPKGKVICNRIFFKNKIMWSVHITTISAVYDLVVAR